MNIDGFISFNLGIIVYFIGVRLNRRSDFLQRFNIPEPVSGGLFVAVVVFFVHLALDADITFDLAARDFLLLYFFTAIGLNARISDLIDGGKPLLILLVLTLGYMVVQNVTGVAVMAALGLPTAMGLLGGTVSLIGGHGTAIAWAPVFQDDYAIAGAAEIGVAAATLGLIMASVIGGPIAAYLIGKKGAEPSPNAVEEEPPSIGVETSQEEATVITHVNLMRAMLVLNIAIGLGWVLNEALGEAGLKLPLFVTCLMMGIVLSNSVPKILPRIIWPAHTNALAVISDLALGVFLCMSLMSLKLWTIAGLAAPILVLIGVQAVIAFIFIVFLLFPLMGRDYQAAVLSAGFGGFALGATPTAIANMTAVTKQHGPATKAFLILPLVSAFFVDLANAGLIRAFLSIG